MRKALTCIVVVLLLFSLCLTLTPKNVLSKTQDIKVVSYSYCIDNLGVLDVSGEIQNIGTDTIHEVILEGTVYGADGTEQAASTTRAWVYYMAPGQKAPFMLEFNTPTGFSDWYTAGVSKITITVSKADAVNSHLYQDLTVSVSSAGVSSSGDDQGTYWVSGTVRNTGSQTATKLAVAATFYNSSGHVVAVGLTGYLEPASVSPSTTVSFKVGAYYTDQTVEPSSRKITSYTLNVQATTPVQEGPASPVPNTSPQQSSPTQTDTTPQNDTLSNQNLMYILIIAGVAVAIVAALLVSRRGKPSPIEVEVKKKPAKKL